MAWSSHLRRWRVDSLLVDSEKATPTIAWPGATGVPSRDMTEANELSREELATLLDLAGELSTQVIN
jgi:hypothetical protein